MLNLLNRLFQIGQAPPSLDLNTMRKPKIKSLKYLLLGLVFSLLAAVPVLALQVQVTPNNPQLGDTLSIVFKADSVEAENPTVSVAQKTYPAFPLGGNRFRAFVPTTPLDKSGSLPIQVKGDGEVKNLTVSLRDRSFPVQRINLPPGKAGVEASETELSRVAAFKKLVTPKKFWNGPLQRPNQGEITSIYGVRRYYNGEFANDYYHRGVDYAGGYGSPVVAPAAGTIALVGRESQGFRVHGNVVGIDHGQGVASICLHLSRIDVREGDFVQAGQVIGAVGSTGAATGPHLHWGLYVNGVSVDPVPWRSPGIE
jgi:lysostaphin